MKTHNYLLVFLILFSFYKYTETKCILITGGAGFIGGTLAAKLLERGDVVIVVDCFVSLGHDQAEEYNALKRQRIRELKKAYPETLIVQEISIVNKEGLDAIFKSYLIDVVCHLAAHAGVRSSIENAQAFIENNILGTVNVLEMINKYKVSHCVLASSSSVYGNSDVVPFTEDQSTDMQASLYGATKKSLELIAKVYTNLYGFSATCLRFFTVYGPYGRFDMSPFIFIDAIHKGNSITIYGDGTVIRDFTYIDDIVEGIIRAIDTPLGFKILNLGTTRTIELNEFIGMIEQVVGNKVLKIYKDFILADVRKTQADTSKAYELLGYNPQTTLLEGIKKTYKWYVENNLRKIG